MNSLLSNLQHPSVLGDWISDAKEHKAYVVQRVRPPTGHDAELVGLKRILESELTHFDTEPCLDEEIAKFRFIEGQGAYIREYFEAVITPLLAEANEKFAPTSCIVGRTESNVTYILENIESHVVPSKILKLHSVLYNALAPDSEYKDLCLDFIVVEGEMLYDITPEFFNNLLLLYRFPFGTVLLYKCNRPVVLVIVTYSMKHKLRMFGSAGSGETCPRLQRIIHGDSRDRSRQRIEDAKLKWETGVRCESESRLSWLSNSTRKDATSDVFLYKSRDADVD